jgi:hypothetical protein
MVDKEPPLVTFREPVPRDVDAELYQLALELVGQVHRVLEAAAIRFHLKDRLDKNVATVALELSRAADQLRSQRWRTYRRALRLVIDTATILDILAHQAAAPSEQIDRARACASRLRIELRLLESPR